MLDYIIADSSIANETLSCLIHSLHPLNLSDHLPISIPLNVTCELTNSTENHSNNINLTRAVESDSITLYSESVSLVTRPLIGIAGQSISELNNEIVYVSNVMKSAALNYLPLVKNKKKLKPRFDSPELKDLCDVSKSAWKRWNAGGRPISGPLYEVKKNANKKVRSCVMNCYAILERQNIRRRDRMFRNGDRSRFKLFSKQKSTCKKLFVENETITDQTEIVEEFRKYFSTLASSCIDPQLSSSEIEAYHSSSYHNDDEILKNEISVKEVTAAIIKLKMGKSAGPDGLSLEHFRYGGPFLTLWITKLLNRIIVLEEIPSCMKEGIITPIYKKQGKDPLLVNSYRGITVSSVFSKLFEVTILNRLSGTLEDLQLPDVLQTAYQKGLSCSDAVFATATEALLIHLCENGHPY